MRKIKNERTVRPLVKLNAAEIEKIVKQHHETTMFRHIERATRATAASDGKKDEHRRRGRKPRAPDDDSRPKQGFPAATAENPIQFQDLVTRTGTAPSRRSHDKIQQLEQLPIATSNSSANLRWQREIPEKALTTLR